MSLHHLTTQNDEDCPLCIEKLSQAHPDLSYWFLKTVKPNFPAAHISWSYRDQLNQEQAFADGKSKLHYPDSPHNAMNGDKPESRALDIFEIINGFALFYSKFYSAVNDLTKKEGIDLLWGAEFKSLGDLDHFQLK